MNGSGRKALIINNLECRRPSLPESNDSETDVEIIKRLFEWLNFEVEEHFNLKTKV